MLGDSSNIPLDVFLTCLEGIFVSKKKGGPRLPVAPGLEKSSCRIRSSLRGPLIGFLLKEGFKCTREDPVLSGLKGIHC